MSTTILWRENSATNNLVTLDALALVNHAEIFIAAQLIVKKIILTIGDYVREVVAGEKVRVINFAGSEVEVFLQNIFLLTVIGWEENFRARITP